MLKLKISHKGKIYEWLEAIDALIDEYTGGKKCLDCPLCLGRSDCKDCIWVIIERENCYDFSERLGFGFVPALHKHERRWQELRLPMLRRWKKILKAELKRRVNNA